MKDSRALTPILMLVPYFAPQTHAAMFRAHKLAKYLPEHGFRPVVVTPDTNYLYNENPALLDELPLEVEIHRARYIEPTLRGIRMALGGADRTFAGLKRQGVAAAGGVDGMGTPTPPPQARSNWGGYVARGLGNWPDRLWTWNGPAFRLASKLIERDGIRLLYSSANPVSFLRSAMRLKRRHGLTWVSDFRDPVGYGRKHTAKGGAIALLQERAILRNAMARADHVTGLAESYGQIFFDLYGLEEDRWSFIPTGLDEAYLDSAAARTRGQDLVHVGEVMANQSNHCFQVLEQLLSTPATEGCFGKLVVIGRREVNEPLIRSMLADLPRLRERLELRDHLPQREVYDVLRQAKAALLLPGAIRYWWNNFAKMVDYIALGVPVVAHVPPISEARYHLEQAGSAFFLTGERAGDTAALGSWLSAGQAIARPGYAERFTAKRQVADFAALFGKLLAERKG